MKQELIELAGKKKFYSKFLYQVAYKYSTKEDLRYLFWMVELQQWLREVYNIHINITKVYECSKSPAKFDGWNIYIAGKDFETSFEINNSLISKYFNTYEEALESGLLEALKLIKKIKL